MSQDDIIKLLEKKKEPLTSKELAQYLKIRQETIIRSLRILVRNKEVRARHPTKEELKNKGYEGKTHLNRRFKIFFIKS